MNNQIRWGILGCGDVCEVKSGPAFQLATGSQLVAVMRRDDGKARDFAARHNVPFWTSDADELINRSDVDAVYIATPPGSHLELALKVAHAKKPCYVEKPMARSAAESRAMLEAFSEAQVPLFVAFYRRGLERFQTVKRLLDEGAIGELSSVSYRLLLPKSEDVTQWRLDAAQAGGGLFLDLASHLLDVFDYLFGPLEQVAGVARNVATPAIKVEDSVSMSFLAAGVPASTSWNFASWSRADRIEIFGTQGKISLSCFGDDDVRLEAPTGLRTFNGKKTPHVHLGLVQSIVDELRGQGNALSTGASALRTMEVMDAVLNDYYGGRGDDFWNRSSLWPKNKPTMNLQFFPADAPNKTGVLVVPGGGYGFVSLQHEGSEVAHWLNARGFDAWVLNYTVASAGTPSPIYPAPQQEALSAIQQIRAQNRVAKLGIWGFSAGGHLSAVTVTNPEAKLDFAVLAYSVISMEPGTTHGGSRHNLIGDNPDAQLQRSLSAQNRVSLSTPPVFLFHTANDPAVPVQNSLLFASEMAAHRRPFELLILPDGPHGIGLALNNEKLTWTGELNRWLKGVSV